MDSTHTPATALEALLQRPDIRAALDEIAATAAPLAAPQDAANVVEAQALLEREQTASAIRAALTTLGSAPAAADRAAGLERLAATARTITTTATTPQPAALPPAPPMIPPATATQQEDKDPKPKDTRGGKRKGAGRPAERDTDDPDDQPITRSIMLKKWEWDQIDQIAKILKTTRSGAIRKAMDGIYHRLKEQPETKPETN